MYVFSNQIRNKINDDLASVSADIKTLKSANGPEIKVIELRTGIIEEFILDTLEKYSALLKVTYSLRGLP